MKFWREGPAENYEQYLFHRRDGRPAACAGLVLLLVDADPWPRPDADPLLCRGHDPDVRAGDRAGR